MNGGPPEHRGPDFGEEVGATETRKIRSRRRGHENVWAGLGLFGLVGWSITVPTLLGIVLGVWLDRNHPGSQSWTLALLLAGVTLGSFNAWHWISKERKLLDDDHPDDSPLEEGDPK